MIRFKYVDFSLVFDLYLSIGLVYSHNEGRFPLTSCFQRSDKALSRSFMSDSFTNCVLRFSLLFPFKILNVDLFLKILSLSIIYFRREWHELKTNN